MSRIAIAYTSAASTTYNFVFDNFSDRAIPRSYIGSLNFDRSAAGAAILGGPAYAEKYQWTISSMVYSDVAIQFDAFFRAWDLDRSNGLPAACGVIDNTFGPQVSANAIFTAAPVYTDQGPSYTLISFGLQEV